jgi:hypothetical protein
MGHTTPANLKDLQDILDEVRTWPGLKERSPNVFYFKSKPFMHFHDKDGKRWADAADGKEWGAPLDIEFGASAKRKREFLKTLRARYEVTCAPKL